MHPCPVVRHPAKKILHDLSKIVVGDASVHYNGLHASVVVSVVHGPSIPINPLHPSFCEYELH